MPKKVDWERRRRVWDYKVQHPDLSGDEIAARLGLVPRTVYKDIEAAETSVNERAAAALRASILSRNAQLIESNLPYALQGKTRNAEIVLACHKEQRELLGIDQPTQSVVETNYTVQFTGVDPDEAF